MLILASHSPRRRDLLKMAGFEFEIEEPGIDEKAVRERLEMRSGGDLPFQALADAIASAKAKAVFDQHPDATVIGADTMVVLDDQILGKPRDVDEAKAMLNHLMGRTHRVITAVSIFHADRELRFHSITEVTFWPRSRAMDAWVDAYAVSGQPLDKAGAYGAQDQGALLIKQIRGDFFTVVGLPISRVARELQKLLPNDSAGAAFRRSDSCSALI